MRDQYGWDGAAFDRWLERESNLYMSRIVEECTEDENCDCTECQERQLAHIELQAECAMEQEMLDKYFKYGI